MAEGTLHVRQQAQDRFALGNTQDRLQDALQLSTAVSALRDDMREKEAVRCDLLAALERGIATGDTDEARAVLERLKAAGSVAAPATGAVAAAP